MFPNEMRSHSKPKPWNGKPARQRTWWVVAHSLLACVVLAATPTPAASSWLSPGSLVPSPDGKTLFVGCETAREVIVFDTSSRKVKARVPVPASPTGSALSADGKRLYVSCAAPLSQVCVLDTFTAKLTAPPAEAGTPNRGRDALTPKEDPDSLPAGHTATGLALSQDRHTAPQMT